MWGWSVNMRIHKIVVFRLYFLQNREKSYAWKGMRIQNLWITRKDCAKMNLRIFQKWLTKAEP